MGLTAFNRARRLAAEQEAAQIAAQFVAPAPDKPTEKRMSDNVVARLRETMESHAANETIPVTRVDDDVLTALLDVVEEARLFLGDESADSDDLCAAVNRVMRGIDGHDWSEWGEPYECGAGMCHIRHCRTCNEYEARPVWAGDA